MTPRANASLILAAVAAIAGLHPFGLSVARATVRTGADVVRGEKLAQTCNTCHGNEIPLDAGDGRAPSPAPRLKNQRAVYLISALAQYRSGQRQAALMQAQAAALSEQDILDVAAYYEQHARNSPSPSNDLSSARSKPRLRVPGIHREVCGGCHGEAGFGILPESPILAGQNMHYLERALQDYASGRRSAPQMVTYARELTPEQIREIAAFFADQTHREILPGAPMALPPPLE